jgi:hypothetical protein
MSRDLYNYANRVVYQISFECFLTTPKHRIYQNQLANKLNNKIIIIIIKKKEKKKAIKVGNTTTVFYIMS